MSIARPIYYYDYYDDYYDCYLSYQTKHDTGNQMDILENIGAGCLCADVFNDVHLVTCVVLCFVRKVR